MLGDDMDVNDVFEEAKSKWKNGQKTPFDDIDTTIGDNLVGGELRKRLGELLSVHSTLTRETAFYRYHAKKMELLRKFVRTKAMEEIFSNQEYSKIPIKRKEMMAETHKVKLPNMEEPVSYFNIALKGLVYEYFADVGAGKIVEIRSSLEVGRSLLSWDKTEFAKGEMNEA